MNTDNEHASRIIEYRKVKASDLRKNPANFRKHPGRQVKALRSSLQAVGRITPLLAYDDPEHGLTLIDGHARLDENSEWDVAIVDLSPDEARLALTLLDPVSAMAETDKSALESLLHEISTDDETVQEYLDNLAVASGVAPRADATEPNTDMADRAEELHVKWGVQPGDVWSIGKHTLVCGDSTDADVVAKALQGRKPLLMVTDPPYGIDYKPGWRQGDINPQNRYAAGLVANDNRSDWQEAYQLSEADVVYVWCAAWFLGEVSAGLSSVGFEPRNLIVWIKSSPVISRGHYHWQSETCWYAVKKGKTARWSGGRKQTNLWEIRSLQHGHYSVEEEEHTPHSTQKPVECMARAVRNHGGRGDIVYDPFCGSGTTLAACEREGRIGIGIELEPKYCAIILERLANAGLEATRATRED